MNTVLNIMDKLYSNSDALKTVYVVGAVLLFIFVIMLITSLRKPEKEKEVKIIEEPKIDDIMCFLINKKDFGFEVFFLY